MKEKNQTNVVRGVIPYYLFVWEEELKNISFAVISLFILQENSLSEGETLDNNFITSLTNQNFCLQHWLGCVV